MGQVDVMHQWVDLGKEVFMQHVEQEIEVEAPLSRVYNQWTQFEEFPEFMEGVEEVKQLDDKRLHWRVKVGGKEKEWTAEIFEQIPDQRIAWRSTSGPLNTGMVNFEAMDSNRTLVKLKLNFEPEGTLESVGSALGVVSARVKGDLQRFKDFIEARGMESGGWRGEIEGRSVKPSASSRSSRQTSVRIPNE
jgi:uncharacterized membrane protein